MNMMDGKSISIRVDGTEIQARAGATILDILNENGIEYRRFATYQRLIRFKLVILAL